MKLSVFISYILIVGMVFFTFALMVKDTNQAYDTNINSSQWDEEYDFVNDLNSTVSPLEQKFKVIQDEDAGFFTKLTAGITALPYAVIIFPQVIFGSLEIGGTITMGFLTALAIPAYLITAIILGILIWALFKLLEFFQRSQV